MSVNERQEVAVLCEIAFVKFSMFGAAFVARVCVNIYNIVKGGSITHKDSIGEIKVEFVLAIARFANVDFASKDTKAGSIWVFSGE